MLYHDRFEYSVSAGLFEANCLRPWSRTENSHESLDARIEYRSHLQHRIVNYAGSWRGPNKNFTEIDRVALHSVLDWHLADKQPHKLIVSSHWIDIFVNDVDSLYDEEFYGFLNNPQIKQAKICLPRDVVLLKNPQHTHRIFLRERRMSAEDSAKLRDFVANQRSEIRINPALEYWLPLNGRYLNGNNFIDCSNPGYEMLLQLLIPGIVRKTLRIEPR